MNSLSGNIDEENASFKFHKNERLCSKKVIDKLFLEGKSVFAYPVKIVYFVTKLTSDCKAQAAFTVGKRNFRKAVHRNLIKRKMREVYRLNKHHFYDEIGEKQVAVFFIFTGKTIPEYVQIEAAIKKGMKKLAQEISDGNS